MRTETKRKLWYTVLKVASIIVSILLPAWAVFEKFPVWTEQYGSGRSFGVGAIILLVVVVVVFRKSVFDYLKDKFKLQHAPPIAVWFGILIAAYILIFIGNFLRDLVVVLWMGVLGCAIGTFLTFICENYFGKKDGNGNGA